MANRPSSGDTDWGTKANAHDAVGHDNDGTHTKSQMLTDMEWSPTTMAGANDSIGTVTFPNGLIMKWGSLTCTYDPSSTTVTFATAFPEACFQAVACAGGALGSGDNWGVYDITKTNFKIVLRSTANKPMKWFAIGR